MNWYYDIKILQALIITILIHFFKIYSKWLKIKIKYYDLVNHFTLYNNTISNNNSNILIY